MNKNIIKIKDGILFGIGFLLILGIAQAAVTLTASENEPLTSVKWNNLVDKISGINTDKTTGNVGIGTESPESNLHLNNNSLYSTLRLDRSGTPNNSPAGMLLGYSDSQFIGSVVFDKQDSNNGNIRFRQKVSGINIDSMILDNGNLGIGTNNPSSKLEVKGGESRLETARIMAPGIGNCRMQVKNACHATETTVHNSNGVSLCVYCYAE